MSLPRFLFLFYNLESMGWMGLNPSSPEELETKSIFFGNKQRGKPLPPLPKRKKKPMEFDILLRMVRMMRLRVESDGAQIRAEAEDSVLFCSGVRIRTCA